MPYHTDFADTLVMPLELPAPRPVSAARRSRPATAARTRAYKPRSSVLLGWLCAVPVSLLVLGAAVHAMVMV